MQNISFAKLSLMLPSFTARLGGRTMARALKREHETSTSPIAKRRLRTSTVTSAKKNTKSDTNLQDEQDIKNNNVMIKKEETTETTMTTTTGKKDVSPPENWANVYDIIREQRKRVIAAVDTMGCAQAGRGKDISEKDRRFGCLIALMLSSQTKDEVTFQAMENLRSGLEGGLSCESVLNASVGDIEKQINKVGFWRRKALYIKQAAESIRDSGGDVPKTIEGMLKLRGVGPKMGYLALNSAWGLNEGIGVDTHVHRITNRLHWHKPPTKTEEQTRLNLEQWLPKELHQEINPLLVGFGQEICKPVNPKCDICDVSSLCPSKKLGPKKSRSDPTESNPKLEPKSEPRSDDESMMSKVKNNDVKPSNDHNPVLKISIER